MAAPDPGLTDLIAAHRLKQSYWNWWGCTGCDWRTKGTYGSEPTIETATEHAKHVAEQHTRRIAELQDVKAERDVLKATIARVQAQNLLLALDGHYDAANRIRAALEGEQQ